MSKYNDKAVALKYRKDKDRAPVIVAAGSGSIAQKIVEIADQKGVPIYKDTSAASLLSSLKVGEAIPADLYNVVAGIYVCIMRTAQQLKEERKHGLSLDLIEPLAQEAENTDEEELEDSLHNE